MIDTATPAGDTRTIWNPVQRDSVTFLITAAESGGMHTRLALMAAPGGGNELHVHLTYAEHFEVTEGELGVRVGRTEHILRPGDKAVVPPGTPHRFFNRSAEPAHFIVELRPGHAGMENALRIIYGLARDGLTNERGIPRNPLHLALVADLSDIRMTGAMSVLNPFMRLLARVARAKGIEAELMRRYCSTPVEAERPVLAGV